MYFKIPVQVIARLGKEIDHEDSIYYWAYKNNIPVYSPALTDGSLGDMLFFHSYKSPGLVIDIVGDIRAMNDEAIKAAPRKTGMIILGGGRTFCKCLNVFNHMDPQVMRRTSSWRLSNKALG